MISSGTNLVMTVIGFAVSTIFIVFVCTRLVCARIQLRAARRSLPIGIRSDLSLLERGLHGLEPVVISTFPTKKYSQELSSSGDDPQLEADDKNSGGLRMEQVLVPGVREERRCTVCLAEYQEKDVLRVLPYCGHAFHITCIDIWLQQHAVCPICRMSLRDSPERKRKMPPLFCAAARSPYSSDTFDSRACNCFNTSTGYSSGRADGQRMEPIQEDQPATNYDVAEAGEIVSSALTEGHHYLYTQTVSGRTGLLYRVAKRSLSVGALLTSTALLPASQSKTVTDFGSAKLFEFLNNQRPDSISQENFGIGGHGFHFFHFSFLNFPSESMNKLAGAQHSENGQVPRFRYPELT
ncbi:hypothetical protein ACLOJK_020747 [Asimina triloba]